MKKKIAVVMLASAIVISFSSCSTSESEQDNKLAEKAPAKLVINSKDTADSNDKGTPEEDSVSSLEPEEVKESSATNSKTEEKQSTTSDNTSAPASNDTSPQKQDQSNSNQTQTNEYNSAGSSGNTSTPDGWLTSDGYYHRSSICYGSNSDFSSVTIMQWHQAKEAGYQPCPYCKPE